MSPDITLLLGTAVVLGVTHTAIGIDHTLPFVLLGRARSWSLRKTLLVTGICGVGHVLSSVVVGLLGVGLGVALGSLQWFEASRGHWAAWLLIGFGAGYAIFSYWRLRNHKAHRHVHLHADGTMHSHEHGHRTSISGQPADHILHAHRHTLVEPVTSQGRVGVALFLVFLVGPCEVLLPLMTAPAVGGSASTSLVVAAVFGSATLLTMLALVAVGWFGLRGHWAPSLEPHLNWVAGIAIALSGVGIRLLGV